LLAENKLVKKKGEKFEEFEAGLLEKPEIRKEYDALIPKYEKIQGLIESRNRNEKCRD
jgi:hypothetical protein